MSHGYLWSQIADTDAAELAVGDVIVNPGAGTGYHVDASGAVRGAGWAELDGTAWTIINVDGGSVTALRDDGKQVTERTPDGARVLRVIR
jgi:hypothetical protein